MDSSQDQGAEVQKNATSQQWESFEEILYDLYIEQDRSLAAVKREMEGRGFFAR
jgi:hypothetical protein